MRFSSNRTRLLAAFAATTVGLGLAAQSAEAAPPKPAPVPAGQGAVAETDAALAPGWRNSSDVLVTGAGDSKGFHLYVAREKDAFAWTTLATLTASALDQGPWTGQVCVTGSGRYAVAVYAPAAAASTPRLLAAGGLAAVVDTRTGKATKVAEGVQLAYFNPACGPGDRALLTRVIGGDDGKQQTDLLAVDAAAAKVTGTRRIAAQLTTPTPAPDGDYGIAHGALVKIGPAGELTPVGTPQGTPFAVQATAHNGIDVASVDKDKAVVQRFARGKVTQIGTGPWNKLQLFGLVGGGNAVVGDTNAVPGTVAELSKLTSDRQVQAVSAQGHLLAQEILTRQAGRSVAAPLARPDARDAGTMMVTVRATRTGRISTGTVTTSAAPTLDAIPTTATNRPSLTADTSTPGCAVGRNDPQIQAFQPSPNMVEWAVDQAVHGRLTTQRPANYLKTGQPAYSPQGMFPPHSVRDGGTVPAQLLLAILAQETNLSQASWHAVPGDTGNPLVSDYYGNRDGEAQIDYSKSDCGYGIGQVTDGMRTGSTLYTRSQQIALATDYAANISAAMNILIDKWNEVSGDNPASSVNNNDPTWIENWFLAVWAYNSGYHSTAYASHSEGNFGVGYLNNPANPSYPANREPFLRFTYADAATPSHWSYPERIMGWVETPQLKGSPSTGAYATPITNNIAGHLSLPHRDTFCSATNNCNAANADPCPNWDWSCWWHGDVTFADCSNGACAKEKLTYGAGAAEPGVQRIYDRDCSRIDASDDTSHDPLGGPATVVYDLNDTSQYALGCSNLPANDGKFTLRFSSQFGLIDTHQAGAGYDGHIWFTHTVERDFTGIPTNKFYQVTGMWSPDLDVAPGQLKNYDIFVHLPSHGGEYTTARYVVHPTGYGNGVADSHTDSEQCLIDQSAAHGTDLWVSIGNYSLGLGARVELNNIDAANPASYADIAFDAMAFIPTVPNAGTKCQRALLPH
ncbi:hypothetical protein Lfu02_73970 [Longispora fulva]|uniref:Transglycosylase SLT domain-containing protein n=1 Tax=Longispora fulva TaxID=619741 RepID=A0A8J7G603_9ACTN|nr:hypothetical protein [Longispora fulva]MBG6134313.1 hypothetical protein [Longispora fulva]GIG63025.1 hypothetical protein Lfu02_73970 [Longispora fulva]